MSEKRKSSFHIACILFFSYLTAISLSVSFKMPVLADTYTKTAMSEIFWNLKNSLANSSFYSTIIFSSISYLGFRLKESKEKILFSVPVSFLLSAVWLMGKSYSIDNSLNSLFSSPGQLVKSFIFLFGMTWLIYLLFRLAHTVFNSQSYSYIKKPQTKIQALVKKNLFLFIFLGIMLVWSVHIIAAYPGYSCIDAWDQLFQFYEVKPFTSHHPPVHTMIMGTIYNIGLTLNSKETGIFLFILVQSLFGAASCAYSIYTITKLKAPVWLTITSFIIVAFVPYYSGYSNLLLKDNLYTYAFLLFMTELVYTFLLKEKFFKRIRHILLMFLAVLSVILLRNNGKYVIYPFAIILISLLIIRTVSKKEKKEYIIKCLALIILPILCASFINSQLTEKFEIAPGSKREALSLFFQQTARYVSLHESSITDEEKEAINAVLDYENLSELYDPRISDPVKSTFKNEATGEELINYFKIWFKHFFKHPMTYINATLNQNYYLVYPFTENDTVYYQTYYSAYANLYPTLEGFDDFEITSPDSNTMTDAGFQKLMFSVPVSGMFSSIAFYNLVLIALFMFSVYRKKIQWIICSVPLVLSNAIIVLAPVIQGHPRYAFPIVYSMPLLVAYYFFINRKIKNISK